MNALIVSLIRTYVPLGVATVVAWLAAANVNIDSDTQVQFAAALTAIVAAAYYGVARLIEEKWPQLGWLLGVAKQPVYDEPEEIFDSEEYTGE